MQRTNSYLIAKGWAGFGDRLQCLSYTLDMALQFRQVLWVDWTDRHWSHDGNGFDRYFDLVDVPYVTSLEQIPASLKVFPSFWSNKLHLQVDEWAFPIKKALLFDPKTDLPAEPLWVHPGIGYRPSHMQQLFKHLRVAASIVDDLKRLMDVAPADMPVVHLRGTDRTISEQALDELQKVVPKACVISDDADLVQRWRAASPNSIVLTDVLATGSKGTHSLDAKSLKKIGFDKHSSNIRLLADFLILARAKEAYALNTDSLFFRMARQLHKSTGGVKKLLEPAPPAMLFPSATPDYFFGYRSTGSKPALHELVAADTHARSKIPSPFKLYVGGTSAVEGWHLLSPKVKLGVDYVGDCKDLSKFPDACCDQVYAHHIIEHSPYKKELPAALAEIHRILKPGATLQVSVPDLDVLCQLFLDRRMSFKERFHIMRIMFGGQVDPNDFHFIGLNFEFLADYLTKAGFRNVQRVEGFSNFSDTSSYAPYFGIPISLNVEAVK